METKLLLIALMASETSVEDILDLIGDNRVYMIDGTVSSKWRDYAAEDILEQLATKGFPAHRAERLEDDEASMLSVEMFVDDSDWDRVNTWIVNNESAGNVQYPLFISKGDRVLAQTQDCSVNTESPCKVVGFTSDYILVEDINGDIFDITPRDIIDVI